MGELNKLAQEAIVAQPQQKPQNKGMLSEIVASGGDYQQAAKISDKLKSIKSSVQSQQKNVLPNSAQTKKILGIPADAKPSEADLNDRANDQ